MGKFKLIKEGLKKLRKRVVRPVKEHLEWRDVEKNLEKNWREEMGPKNARKAAKQQVREERRRSRPPKGMPEGRRRFKELLARMDDEVKRNKAWWLRNRHNIDADFKGKARAEKRRRQWYLRQFARIDIDIENMEKRIRLYSNRWTVGTALGGVAAGVAAQKRQKKDN